MMYPATMTDLFRLFWDLLLHRPPKFVRVLSVTAEDRYITIRNEDHSGHTIMVMDSHSAQLSASRIFDAIKRGF